MLFGLLCIAFSSCFVQNSARVAVCRSCLQCTFLNKKFLRVPFLCCWCRCCSMLLQHSVCCCSCCFCSFFIFCDIFYVPSAAVFTATVCAFIAIFFLLVCVFAGFRCCSQSAVVVSQVRERLLILLGLFHFFALCSFLFNIFTFLYLFESLNALNARIYLSIYLC